MMRHPHRVTPVPRHDQQLDELAARLVRLVPTHRDPERFHIEKDTLAAELRRLARDMRRAG
jgi:hypothetical protein